jgi:thiol-disulfide isomerase/thioredoxin
VTRNLALAAALLVACASAGPRPTVKIPALAGKPFAATAQDLSGKDVRIEAAGKVLVVDFFASWCDPCRAQMPHLDGLARDLGGRGLAVVGVSFDEERFAAEGFASQLGVSFPVLWDRGGERLARPLDIERLPTTLLVDRAGVVRHVHVGYDARVGAEVEAEVRALLDEPSPTTAAARP